MPETQHTPPPAARRFLQFFLRKDLLEEVEGDLEESYYAKLEESSGLRANLHYWYQVINYLRPFALSEKQFNNNNYTMVRNYLKIGWRNMFRNLGYSLINIGGMALGLSTVILIGLWVHDELTYNRNHVNYESVGQIMRTGNLNGEKYTTNWLPYALALELRENYSHLFDHVVTAFSPGSAILGLGTESYSKSMIPVDPEFIEAFTLPMISGNEQALEDPYSIVLSESLAQTLFGDEDPYFKSIRYNNKHDLKVTGVFRDLPHNSRFRDVEFFISSELNLIDNPWMLEQGYTNNFLQIYVQLNPQRSYDEVSAAIQEVIFEQVKDQEHYTSVHPQLFVHPMEKWHLYGEWDNGVNTGRIRYVKLFGTIGIFILLLACINFMNLSTARSEKRAREIGVRKSIGSGKAQLIFQFLTESLLIVSISFVASLLISALLTGVFNQLADKHLAIPWTNPYFWLISIVFILATGLLAGSYPSFYLSAFNPVRILKGTFRTGRNSSLPRKILVVIQFTVSVVLVIGTIVVHQQIQYAKGKPVGYEREGLVMVPMATDEYYEKYELIRDRLVETGYVADVAQSMGPVTDVWSSNGGFTWKGQEPNEEGDFATISVSANFGDVVKWNFVEGRNFSEDMASDSSGVILNETAVKLFGMDQAEGEVIIWDPTWAETQTYRVIGVIEDVVMRSPYFPNMPAAYFLDGRGVSHLNIRIREGASLTSALSAMEETMRSIFPNVPFTYEFADDAYARKFDMEERVGRLATAFAILAIIISCLGLFGLAAYVAEQKTKEIGIRKVVGASTINLWGMLTKNFIILVFVSSLMSIPLAYFGMNEWLQDYEYRVSIGWWVFGLTIAGALLVAVLTVSYQAIRAARLNPVVSLRSE